MKASLIALALFLTCFCLHGEELNPPTPKRVEIKTEIREFKPTELHDVKLDLSDASLSFTVGTTTYTYTPTFDSDAAKIAACATLLSELRHATKLLVTVKLPSADQVYSQFFVLQFDSLK